MTTHLNEHTFAEAVELEPGIQRVTLPLPDGPRHVHCYLLEAEDGWTLVDTGLGLTETPWPAILARSGLHVARIFITHMHPDHVGGAEAAAEATGAAVLQGELDYAQCERVWGSHDWPERMAAWFRRHGVPSEVTDELIAAGHVFSDFVRFAPNPILVAPGDTVAGWRVVALPGHADGHLALVRDGVLIAGDALLTPTTPTIGLYPESRPDPLGDYLDTLATIAALDVRVAYAGHGAVVAEPAARARAIAAHHTERLLHTESALAADPRTGFDVSLAVFGRVLAPIQRRFAVAETLSHIERLVRLGRAERHEDGLDVSYTGRSAVGREPA